LFVHDGVFDFDRWITVSLGGEQVELPDFIVELPDYRLERGSPAIDAGTCEGAPETDIEGTPRPQGAGCDIGAYEYTGPIEIAFVRGDANADGSVNIADPICTIAYIFEVGPPPPCLDASDTNDDSTVDVADAIFALQYLFAGGPVIPMPYPECGIDPEIDGLECDTYPPCWPCCDF
jgi:hypothetical protein